jgi:hypothetical protein
MVMESGLAMELVSERASGWVRELARASDSDSE